MVNKGVIYLGDISGNLGTINSSGQLRVEAAVSIPPVSANVSGNMVYLPNDGVNNVVSISGQTVVASVNVAANVSGNTVYLVNDSVRNVVKVSGETLSISGNVRTLSGSVTNISGNHVSVSGIVSVNSLPVISISGNAVLISGQTVTVANAVSTGVSGQTIYLVDDSINNKVKISGQTIIAQISGQTVTISNAVSTGVSGQTIYFVNDGVNNVVKISGQTVDANIFGSNGISPEVLNDSSIDTQPSNESALLTAGLNYGFDSFGGDWARLRVTNSGDGFRLLVSISGQPVTANVTSNVSGQTVYLVNDSVNNVTKISGQHVSISGTVAVNSLPVISISGNMVSISGQPVVATVTTDISGQTVYLVSGQNRVQITDTSGNQLSSISGFLRVSISGQPVTTSVNVTTDISGQVVYLVSGQNRVQISGQTVRISDSGGDFATVIDGNSDAKGAVTLGLTTVGFTYAFDEDAGTFARLRTTASGDGFRLIVSISGQPVTASVTSNISGQVVRISGQTVSVSGVVNVGNSLTIATLPVISVSGNAIKVSGETLSVSGIVAVNSLPVISVSGSSVRLPNDGVNNVVWISGQVVTATLNPGPTNISGQVIYFVDNGVNNVVKISGQTVVASVSLGTTPTSGDAARISGQSIYIVDDSVNNKVKISGQLVAVSGIVAVNSLPVISTSGNATLISGQFVAVSGTVTTLLGSITNVSGATVSVSGIVSIGNAPTVLVSGGINVSGNTISISGIVRTAVPTAVRTRALLACTALSGGTQLLSGDVRKATVVNAGSAGTVMYIGSTTDPPFSGFGLYLSAGNGYTTETNNFNNIRAFAATSGGFISYIGEQF